jgi:hypothetical protein
MHFYHNEQFILKIYSYKTFFKQGSDETLFVLHLQDSSQDVSYKLIYMQDVGNDANQPVARYFNNGNHSVSDMVIQALCPINGSNDSCERHEMRLISKLGTVRPSGINERFSYV